MANEKTRHRLTSEYKTGMNNAVHPDGWAAREWIKEQLPELSYGQIMTFGVLVLKEKRCR